MLQLGDTQQWRQAPMVLWDKGFLICGAVEQDDPGCVLCTTRPDLGHGSGGVLARWASFFEHSPPMPVLAPPHQTIWSTFSQCLRIWPVLCTQFMMMARVVVGSGGNDILCC